jgi:hypothetical protein
MNSKSSKPFQFSLLALMGLTACAAAICLLVTTEWGRVAMAAFFQSGFGSVFLLILAITCLLAWITGRSDS